MADFSQDIQNFQRYGTYTYKFDSVGNLNFESASAVFNRVYIAFPLKNVIYNPSKIKTIYNIEFEEFIPQSNVDTGATVDNLQQQLDVVQQENITLKSHLDTVIAQNQESGSDASNLAVKQVILELRKSVGQGRVDSDFSDTFPYTPIIKTNI